MNCFVFHRQSTTYIYWFS